MRFSEDFIVVKLLVFLNINLYGTTTQNENTRVLHSFFWPILGGINSCSGDLGRANACPGTACFPKRHILCFRDRGDMPGGREPVHTDHR